MGFPHSEIFGSKCIGNSPKLIAAYHVLHRLSVPRHPPNALLVLDLTFCQRNDDSHRHHGSFRAGDDPHPRKRPCYPFLRPRLGDGARKSRLLRPHTSDKRCQRTNSAPSAPRVLCRAFSRTSDGGGRRDRTDDLLLAKQALSQLSYAPVLRTPVSIAISLRPQRGPAPRPKSSRPRNLVGQGGFEPPTSRLSSARSNQLSY